MFLYEGGLLLARSVNTQVQPPPPHLISVSYPLGCFGIESPKRPWFRWIPPGSFLTTEASVHY